MEKEHQIIRKVYAAKKDNQAADELISAYIPFIRSEASKYLMRVCTEQDDEYSIAMIAFHEAILSFSRERGAFLHYASMLIRSRLIDYHRKEARHRGHLSLEAESGEDERSLMEELSDTKDHYTEVVNLEATRQEIEELGAVLKKFGVSFSDIAENSPKQERTMSACSEVVRYAVRNREILEELERTGKLPMTRLAAGVRVERKTLERHRKYLLAMLLIQTNGYEIIRGHLYHLLSAKGGSSV